MYHKILLESDKPAARLKQINTLKVFNDNVSEIVKNEEYKVEFDTSGRTASLIVKLGPDFPLEKPSLYIHPPVMHPWVSATGDEIVSAPGLLNFSEHSDLGRVVQAIIRELELRPPLLLNGDISPPQQQTINQQNPYMNCVYNDTNFNVSESSSPPYPLAFPVLKELTTAQLQELNENSDLLNRFIGTLNLGTSAREQMNALIEENENLACDNMKREPELIQLQQDVSSLYSTLQEYKSKYEELSSVYRECGDKYNPYNIIQRLRQSVSEIDEESEKIAESFLTGDLDLDTFLFDYVNHRIISHSRKVKDEKLSQQLEKLHQAGY